MLSVPPPYPPYPPYLLHTLSYSLYLSFFLREREREREKEREIDSVCQRERDIDSVCQSICVSEREECVCVCVREGQRRVSPRGISAAAVRWLRMLPLSEVPKPCTANSSVRGVGSHSMCVSEYVRVCQRESVSESVRERVLERVCQRVSERVC